MHKCDTFAYTSWSSDNEVPKDIRDSLVSGVIPELYLQHNLDVAQDNGYDAFSIITTPGDRFGSVWFKKFDEKCVNQVDGQITLDQLDESIWNVDFYIRKSRVACGRGSSVPDAATCCANSANDPNYNDSFLESC